MAALGTQGENQGAAAETTQEVTAEIDSLLAELRESGATDWSTFFHHAFGDPTRIVTAATRLRCLGEEAIEAVIDLKEEDEVGPSVAGAIALRVIAKLDCESGQRVITDDQLGSVIEFLTKRLELIDDVSSDTVLGMSPAELEEYREAKKFSDAAEQYAATLNQLLELKDKGGERLTDAEKSARPDLRSAGGEEEVEE